MSTLYKPTDTVIIKKGAKDINAHAEKLRTVTILSITDGEIVAERSNGHITVLTFDDIEKVIK